MKKVLFAATVDSHILQFHLPFLKYFKENDYEVHVVTNGDEKIPYCDVKHKVSFERSPFKLNNLKAIKDLKRIVNKEKYDIIHCHTPMGSVITRLASNYSRKNYGTRLIYTAHGFHFYKGAPIINWLLFYPVEKYLSKYTDTLITINMEDYELAKRKFTKCNDIQYVPGVGIDPKKFDFSFDDTEKEKLRKSLGLKKDDFIMIYPAELSKRKRQVWLIDSLKDVFIKYRNIHLLLPGMDSLNGECQKLVDELNLNKQIHFLGYRKDIPQLLKISNIALSAANQEGLPVNLMEAMYIGLPIVASNCRGNRDLVKDNENGYLIELKDSDKFLKSIEYLYKNNKETNIFKNNNKKTIKDYLLSKILLEMERIYNKKETVLIIPTCTDLNRGDQALVLETKRIIDSIFPNNACYMMSTGETVQCEKFGLEKFSDILKHPSRFSNKKTNVKYNLPLKIKWGIVACIDFIISSLLFNSFSRNVVILFLSKESKKSINLYKEAKYVFVKGGGFLHDYSKGLIGWYTIYYQIFHIKLALKMGKKVYVMPNSYGPFKNKITAKMVRNVLNDCEVVTARESISASKKYNNLGIDIDLYPDLAFFMNKKISTFNVEKLMFDNNIDVKKDNIVAITVRPYRFYSYSNPEKKYLEYKESFVKFIEYLTSIDFKVLLVVHTRAENDHENDERCIDEIFEMIKHNNNVKKIKNDNLNCYDLKKIYGYCKYVVGTRFHSVIFSLEQNIPCIAVTYGGNKGDGIMKDLGLSKYAIKIGELSAEKLINLFNKMRKDKIDICLNIDTYIKNYALKYDELIEIIKKHS